MCAVAYALRIEELERRATTDDLAAILAASHGADVPVPDPAEQRAAFDRWLASEPTPLSPIDSDRAMKMRALGLPK